MSRADTSTVAIRWLMSPALHYFLNINTLEGRTPSSLSGLVIK